MHISIDTGALIINICFNAVTFASKMSLPLFTVSKLSFV